MANLIVISGPQAVGKMTVAKCLKEKIGYSLMTNHDSIETSIRIFGSDTDAQKELNDEIRKSVFDIALKNRVNMIFTFVVAFDVKSDIDYLNDLRSKFEASGGNFYFVELMADVDVRLERNATLERLDAKPTKRNIEWSNNELLESMKMYRLNSNDDEFICDNHIKIDNNNLFANEVADMIIENFKLNKTC